MASKRARPKLEFANSAAGWLIFSWWWWWWWLPRKLQNTIIFLELCGYVDFVVAGYTLHCSPIGFVDKVVSRLAKSIFASRLCGLCTCLQHEAWLVQGIRAMGSLRCERARVPFQCKQTNLCGLFRHVSCLMDLQALSSRAVISEQL